MELASSSPAEGKAGVRCFPFLKSRRKSRFETVRRKIPLHYYYVLLFLIIVFFALLRFRLRDTPLERDEGEYAYAGQLMLQGIPPYQFVYTMKLPGTAAAYAAILAVFGQTPAGIHTGLIFVNAATTLLVFLLGMRLYGRLAGLVAAASYALSSTSPKVMGFAGHATHFVVLFAVAGILVLLKALESSRTWFFFAGGLLLGLGFLMKQPGLLFLLFAGVYVIQQEWKVPINWKKLAVSTGSLALGGALPFVVTCLLLLRDGFFHKFWFWTFAYAQEYGTSEKLSDGITNLLGQTVAEIVGRATVILLFIALILVTMKWSAHVRSHAFFTISFLVFSALAVCPGFYFRNHYFILMLPAVSILAGMIVSGATERLLLWHGSLAVAGLPLLFFMIAFSAAIFSQRKFLFQMDPLEACRDRYWSNPFPEAVEIANYIKNHSPEDATVAVLGSEPEIYFYSHRHSATGYIYMYPLLEPQRYALAMQKQMIGEIEAASPDVMVFVNVSSSWVHTSQPRSTKDILLWVQGYVQQHYVMEGVADIGSATEYHWGEKAKDALPRWGEKAQDALPRAQDCVWIFKRKSS